MPSPGTAYPPMVPNRAAKAPGRGSWRAATARPKLAAKPVREALATLVAEERMLFGTPEILREQIARDGEADLEELMLQWFDLDDAEGPRAFARAVV